jgi:hypothetical protein
VSRGFSPLERRALLALISLIRDREPDPDEWQYTYVPLRALHDRLYIPGERPWVLERRNQRQATRRALGRLHPDYVCALALGWCEVGSGELVTWQGGGSRQHYKSVMVDTPRWRLVGLTDIGVKVALLLEQEVEP